ncbi:hypothetical protein [Actinomadura gamaensis]|uniref:Uncharacterized protein n=1 Tax=Actinomadura gamaensis TaxID=1763541 RepID=A0ABV9TYC8_9ACTN
MPGLVAALAEPEQTAVAVAGLWPHASGLRPVLVVEQDFRAAHRAESGDRVDAVLARLLGRIPGAGPGWQLQAQSGWATVRTLDGSLYGGPLVLPHSRTLRAAELGGCVLLVGTELRLADGLGTVPEGMARLNAVAREGRLVGGVDPVTA